MTRKLLIIILFVSASAQSYGQTSTNEDFKDTLVREVVQLLTNCDLEGYSKPSEFAKTDDNIIYKRCEVGDAHFVGPYEVLTRIESREPPYFKQDLFYTFGDTLHYARETELYIDKETSDTIRWICQYFFKKGELIDYRSLGRGKSESEDWEPEETLLKYAKYKKKYDN